MILIATPDQVTQQQFHDWLSSQGYRVAAVERGSDVLLAVAEDNIRLVILDLSIQEPSGAKTVEILRKIRPRLPVIVLSGDHSIETGRQVLQHGVFYYLLKPVDVKELDQVVQTALVRGKRSAVGIDEGAPKTGSEPGKG
jgi:DNA-binding NtrC family response regulator